MYIYRGHLLKEANIQTTGHSEHLGVRLYLTQAPPCTGLYGYYLSTILCEHSSTEISITVAGPLNARASPPYIRRPRLLVVILFSSASKETTELRARKDRKLKRKVMDSPLMEQRLCPSCPGLIAGTNLHRRCFECLGPDQAAAGLIQSPACNACNACRLIPRLSRRRRLEHFQA